MSDKTSPYIFPFRPFLYLDRPAETSSFGEARTMAAAEFSGWLDRFAPVVDAETGGSIEEAIFSVFINPGVIFGDPAFVAEREAYWLERIAALVAANRPIEMTILGFPYKMPVPLKTNRKLADFGEVVSLARLNRIGEAIAKVYAPGARVHVFTEGPFGAFNGVSRADSDAYFASLEDLQIRFGLNGHLQLHDLNRVIEDNPDFQPAWEETKREIAARRDAGDVKTLDAIRDALPVRFHNLANPGVSEAEIAQAYRRDPEAADLIASIQARAESGVVTYRAFLEARDKIGLLERMVVGALAMTVSPRPGRLGVRPMPLPAQILPYHGVPVLSADGRAMDIVYLWDLRRTGKTYQPVHLAGDGDSAPFAYIEQ